MAILSPLHKDNEELEISHRDFAEQLTDQLLQPPRDKRLFPGDEPTVLPAALQILGATLERAGGTAAFSRQHLKEFGGRIGLLVRFVEDVKTRVFRTTGIDGQVTLGILRALVSNDGAREEKAVSEIEEATRQPQAVVQDALNALKELKVVYPTVPKPTAKGKTETESYRLVHDYLLEVLDEAPDPSLQRLRDRQLRMRFWTERYLLEENLQRGTRIPVLTQIRRALRQTIPAIESFRLLHYANTHTARKAVWSSILAFLVKSAVIVLLVSTALVMYLNKRRVDSELSKVEVATPPVALSTIILLMDSDSATPEQILVQLRKKSDDSLLELLLLGTSEFAPKDKDRAALEISRLVNQIVFERARFRELAGATIAILDRYPCRNPELHQPCNELRDEVVRRLRQRQPPPSDNPADWVSIPQTTFVMGDESKTGRSDEFPVRRVTLKSFTIMTHEVSNSEYRHFDPNHSPSAPSNLPVVELNWYLAYAYSAWVGGRLPTEAEWELAAKSECVTWPCDQKGATVSLDDVAWHSDNSDGHAHPIKTRLPNQFGLYDMVGNVWEWVADWYGPYSSNDETDPRGPDVGPSGKVIRGGSFWNEPKRSRPTSRSPWPANDIYIDVGFRVVRPLIPGH